MWFHANLLHSSCFLILYFTPNFSDIFIRHYLFLRILRARRFLLPTFRRPLRGRFLCGCGIIPPVYQLNYFLKFLDIEFQNLQNIEVVVFQQSFEEELYYLLKE
jgi:hypothetical protein